MPTKAEMYAQMAEKVAVQLTGSWQEWAGFLTTAARLYKYPFHEQLMIYAQRPDATACAEYDLWNDRMGRYVRRGSKGIALVDDSGDRPRLRYVFDISDTGTREHSRTPWLWQLEERHIGPLSAMLERNYDVSSNDLAQQLADVAAKLAEEYWDEHRQDILYIVDGSFLEEYDEYNIEVQFKSAATVSITYVAYRKAGYSKKFRQEHEEEILLHQAAKEAFNELNVKKLPTIKELQTEYAKLLADKKTAYAEYRQARAAMRELLTVKNNVDRVLAMEQTEPQQKEKDHGQR